MLKAHRAHEPGLLESAHAGLQRRVQGVGSSRAARRLRRFDEADAAREVRARQAMPFAALCFQSWRLNGPRRRALLRRNRQPDLLPCRESGWRRSIGRERNVERVRSDLPSGVAGLAGELHHGIPDDHRVLQHLAVARVLQVHRPAAERLQRSGRGAGHGAACVVAQVQGVDAVPVLGEIRRRVAGLDGLPAAHDADGVLKPGISIPARKLGRRRGHVCGVAAVFVIRDIHHGVLQHRQHIAILVVGHARAAAVHPAAGKLHRPGRPDQAVAIVERRLLGTDVEAVGSRHPHVAVERQHRLVLRHQTLVAGDGERPCPAALVGGDADAEQLHRAVRVERLALEVDADVATRKRDPLEAAARHFGDRLRIGANARLLRLRLHPRPQLPGHDDGHGKGNKSHHQAHAPLPASHTAIVDRQRTNARLSTKKIDRKARQAAKEPRERHTSECRMSASVSSTKASPL